MDLLYQKKEENDEIFFSDKQLTHLFGKNIGIIPNALKILGIGKSEPYDWHFTTQKILDTQNLGGNAIIINSSPKNTKELNLYQIREVFGYCASGWTPILLHLDYISYKMDLNEFDGNDFKIQKGNIQEHIFTFLYMSGTIKDGQLFGTFNPANPSSTNSAFLWPTVMKYFISKINFILNSKS